MRVLNGIDELRAAVGEHLGYSDYRTVSQADINTFADLTGDHQWIHVDPDRAKDGPFGGTIAHGLLTLSLGPRMVNDIFRIEGMRMGVNYGYDRIRFPAPVPVDSKVRVGAALEAVEEVPGGVQVRMAFTWEIEGGNKPACVAAMLLRYSA
ncbi:MaoC family dehydratase [Streptomyces spinoverrucosus]|uniref:MaoC family dehydratase n=1 Tax=Streptomyces spinoverrucosus TaxID=284043 RepID=UPI0018C35FDA|nr:MaoC family dehydratase [Streptomyces spinoverrucosus]MBG0855803.1 MaoC family dehydratase [Streptomyces spinoverrucosus]